MNSVIDNMKGEQAREAARTLVRAASLAAKGGKAAVRAGVRLAAKTANRLAERRREREAERERKAKEVTSTLAGYPETHTLRSPDGRTALIVVAPVALTPLRAQFAHGLGGLSAIVMAGMGVGVVALLNDPAPYWWAVAALGPLPFIPLMRFVFSRLLLKRTVFEFTPQRITVHLRRGRTVRACPKRR